jgi:methyltransferase (TIGR00027 family)
MTEVSHHDACRTGVGKTAFGVAGFRAFESMKDPSERLIYDEFAISLLKEENTQLPDLDKLPVEVREKLDHMINGLAVRTKKIDEELLSFISEADQIVVVGAGLDFRPWRIHNYIEKEEERIRLFQGKRWIEIDFQEIFDYKLSHIAKTEAKTYFQYIPMADDCTVKGWEEKLIWKGYDSSAKTIWILEGLTGYLTEEELKQLMTSLTYITRSGSKMMITFLGPNYSNPLDVHRFHTNQPLAFLESFKWKSSSSSISEEKSYDFKELLLQYNRSPLGWDDYYLVTAYLE